MYNLTQRIRSHCYVSHNLGVCGLPVAKSPGETAGKVRLSIGDTSAELWGRIAKRRPTIRTRGNLSQTFVLFSSQMFLDFKTNPVYYKMISPFVFYLRQVFVLISR